MPVEFHALAGRFVEVPAADLRLPHLLEILEACLVDPDVTIVATHAASSGAHAEAIVIDIECDGIPSRNPLQLRSPERLAVMMTEDQNLLPAVLALRKDFNGDTHLLATRRGEPKWLCLYFAPARDVYRTWTGPSFLRQLRWWLVQTAKGTLHAADQPVELPFYDSLWEVIVPPNLAQLRQQAGVQFVLRAAGTASNDDGTVFLEALQGGQVHAQQFGVGIIDAPRAAQAGRIQLPFSLGDLDVEFAERGGNLSEALKAMLGQLPEGGVRATGLNNRFMLLVNFPVSRQAAGEAEAIQQIALVAGENYLVIGAKLGIYDVRDGQANNFQLVGQAAPEGDWRAILVEPASVLKGPDSASFRQYSGVPSAGPVNAALVGVGSLGSELLNLWLRAGWGDWSIVDPDHLKPHNLARHIGFARDLGKPKVMACDEFATAIFGAKKLKSAIAGDAADAANEAVVQLLDSADLVVDCSTKLDFPRLSSRSDRAARHVSVFLTPSGNGSVLLSEDAARTTRLATLESQYYRAIINNHWGARHLEKHLGTFWSGASCRDISYELPLSSVVVQAGTLAERLPRAVGVDQASILVWERDVDTGAISTRAVEATPGHAWNLDPLTVHADEGLLTKLRQMRVDAHPRETGGILVGYHDLSTREVYIVDALPAPPDSEHSEGHFERGIEGVRERLQDIHNRTANIVSYIGEWHSHPPGHGAGQSLDDRIQAAVLAFGMADDGLPFLQLIVGEGEVRVHGAMVRPVA
jgi:hypothetical protein